MTPTTIPHLDALAAQNASLLVSAASLVELRDELQRLRTAVAKFEDSIEDIIAEFGDQPAQCLAIISERIQLAQHYRAHPGAPRVE